MTQDFQAMQNFLTAAVAIVVTLLLTLMVLDLIAGLVDLWNRCSSKVSTPHPIQPASKSISQPEFAPLNPSMDTVAASHADREEAVALVIEQSKQATIRAAARRLGIAVRINGHYQRLAILRAQLKAQLISHPNEVARVFSELTATAAA